MLSRYGMWGDVQVGMQGVHSNIRVLLWQALGWMLSTAVSDPSGSLAVDVQFNTVLNSERAEQRIPTPRNAAPLWEGSCPTMQLHGYSPWLEFVFQFLLEKIAAELLCYLLTKRIQEEDSLSSCRSSCPLDTYLSLLVPLWQSGDYISLLLPSPAERCVSLGQGLPLAETDLCLTPVLSRCSVLRCL